MHAEALQQPTPTAVENSQLPATDADCCPVYVRYWHKADISRPSSNVYFWGRTSAERCRMSAFDPKQTWRGLGMLLQSCADPFRPRQGGSNKAMVEDWGRATPGRPPISSGERNHAVTSRPVGAVSRSRHKTRPCNIRASGTAKVGTITSG